MENFILLILSTKIKNKNLLHSLLFIENSRNTNFRNIKCKVSRRELIQMYVNTIHYKKDNIIFHLHIFHTAFFASDTTDEIVRHVTIV